MLSRRYSKKCQRLCNLLVKDGTVEESLAGNSRKFDVEEMSQYIDQTIRLIGQTFN